LPDDDPVGGVLNRVPKYVASTTLKTLEWRNATLLEGDVPRAVAALKDARSGEIQVHGSCGLLQTLIEHDLIDEYRLWTFPVLRRLEPTLIAGGHGYPLIKPNTAQAVRAFADRFA
jgi:dihydrofolate reductase